MKQGWEYTTFADVMSPAKSERCGDRTDLPVLSITMRRGIIFQSERFNKVIASKDTKDYKIVKEGQLVIAFPIDEGLIYTQDIAQEGIMSPAYDVWNVDYSRFNKKFLNLYFHSPWAMKYYKSKLRGTTLRRRMIPKEDLLALSIPVPPREEQEKIVAELDCLSGVIERKREQLRELDALAQSIFYQMFGDPITNEKGWEVSTIENVCSSIVRGPFGSALKKEYFVEQSNTTYKVYEQKHAIQKDSSIGTYYISADMFETLSRFEIKEGDIIMSCSGTIGEFYEIPIGAEKGIMNQALLKYTLNKNIHKIYFLYVMEWVKENFEKKGSGLQNIGSVKTIKSTDISLPPLTLQQEFADKIEAIEKQKQLIKKSIEETETLFNARMNYYFN